MALDVFITPKPCETIFSMLSRAHILTGSISPLVTLKDLTGHRGYKPLSSLPSNMHVVCEKLHLKDPPEVVIRKHTLFNLYRPFLKSPRQNFIIQGMLNSGAVKSRLGLLKSHCGAADQLAYCCECAKDDIFTYGFPYWRREHMLVGVEVCHLHKLPLTKISLNNEIYNARNLQIPGFDKSVTDWGDLKFQKLCFIAEQIATMANMEIDIFIDSGSYINTLVPKHLVTPSFHVRIKVLQKLVRDWLEPLANIDPYDELISALDVERNWVANLVAGREGMHHPIKHIILWGALNFDYFTAIQLLQSSEQLALPLTSSVKQEITKELLAGAIDKYPSARGAARFLNCSVGTVLVLMEKFGFPIKRRAKKLNHSLINKVLDLTSEGIPTATIAIELGLSIPTINRIKRGCS